MSEIETELYKEKERMFWCSHSRTNSVVKSNSEEDLILRWWKWWLWGVVEEEMERLWSVETGVILPPPIGSQLKKLFVLAWGTRTQTDGTGTWNVCDDGDFVNNDVVVAVVVVVDVVGGGFVVVALVAVVVVVNDDEIVVAVVAVVELLLLLVVIVVIGV